MEELKLQTGLYSIETKRRHQERKEKIQEVAKEIPEAYAGDIRLYEQHCMETYQEVSLDSLLDYLYVSIQQERVKKSTWERRLAANKKHFVATRGVSFKEEVPFGKEIDSLRKMYNADENVKLKQIKGKSHLDKNELLDMIYELPLREQAICLINLITANRPSEMVRIRIENFELDAREIQIYMVKQKEWHTKRLTQEAIRVVKEYIRVYNLTSEDYFIGKVDRWGNYESKQISERAYNRSLEKWVGLSAYNFRKSQVVAMHQAGADLPTIAGQTGHKSLETLSKHYLKVTNTKIDQYL